MNKKIIIAIILGTFLIIGGVFVSANVQEDDSSSEEVLTPQVCGIREGNQQCGANTCTGQCSENTCNQQCGGACEVSTCRCSQ